jgi:hypothetical protein
MSVDLTLSPVEPIRIGRLLPKVSAILAELLDLNSTPNLRMTELEAGVRRHPVTDVMGTDHSPLLILTIEGVEESASLFSRADRITISAVGARSHVQFALMAALAIVLAREVPTSPRN